ncbi:calcium-binding protein [Pelagibius sp.]|uniref:calcium-binding protein n=1 Tax=Pelagibius sp. TaxID=1931238 RepID=UPI003BB079AF
MHTRFLGNADGAVNMADALVLGAAAWLLYKSNDYDLEAAWEEVKSKVTAEAATELVVGAIGFGVGAAAVTTLLGPLGVAAVVTFGAYATYDDFRTLLDAYREEYPDWEFLEWLDTSLDELEAELKSFLPDLKLEFPDVYIADKETKVVGDENTNLQMGRENSVLEGEGGDDYLVHFGYGEMDGGAGDDLLVAIFPDYVSDGEGGFLRLEIDGGAGNDTIISIGGNGPIVHGGAGDDWIFVWSFGAEVYGDEGADRFFWAPDILIADAEAHDSLSFFGITLTGGIAYGGEEAQWAFQSFLPFIRYGLNTEGELVIDVFGHQMFVADYKGGPGADENSLGIYLARIEFAFYQILDDRPALEASPLSEIIGAQLKAMGITHPDDPLALDLDGDGLEFTGLKTSDTYFDLDGDGFAERTAWLRSDDGFLAMDRDGDGAIGDIAELFGAPGVSGFSELAELDSNGDGVIDALDSLFGDLLVWRDLNQDGVSSSDELFSLADLDITSINLNATVINTETPSQNVLHAESTFTRGDGSQGNLYDVLLDASQFDTQYMGDPGIADWAAQVPDLKGYGLLTDLQLAVSNDFGVAETLAQVGANLNVVDLDALVAATEPLLLAWNAANTDSQELAPVLVQTDANGAQWLDHGVYQEDAQGGYWTLANGNPILDGGGVEIPRATLEDLLAQTTGADQVWRLEQMWSPERSTAPSDRPAAPYKVSVDAAGVVTVLDYGIHHEDAQGSYWTLASGADILDGLGDPIARPTLDDILAQAPGEGAAWRVESFAPAAEAAVVDSFAVFYLNGNAVDYSVYVDDPNGGYWASAQAVAEAVGLGLAAPAGPTHADLQGFVDLYLVENAGSITGSQVVETEKAGYAIKTGGAELSDLNSLVASIDGSGDLVYVQNVEQQAEFLQEVMERYEFWGEAVAVRVASQTGLSSFFQGVVYNAETDVFEAATVRELIPLYEAIFAAAPGDAQGALDYLQAWREILDVVYADFEQHGNGAMSASFVFANVVAAYESTGLAAGILEAAEILGVPTETVIHDTTDNAVVDGTGGRDIFYLSTGDQTLRGGQDSDVYVVGKNFGNDVIDESEAPFSNRGPDLLRFADIGSTEISAHREGIDLILTVDATGDTLRIKRQFEGREPGLFGGDASDDTGVTEIAFADGVVWDRVDIAWAVADPQATSDLIEGTPEIDVLDGGAGDDTLIGGEESDLYVFKLGYGKDVIEDNNDNILIEHTDVVLFGEGIEKDNVTLQRDGNSDTLVFIVGDGGDELKVVGQFSAIYTGPLGKQWLDRIELFTFDDGSYYSAEDIMVKLVADAKTAGDDTIYGFAYEDNLDGGLGNDRLVGAEESDTYIFGAGYGHDTVFENSPNILSGNEDRVVFKDGITEADVTFSRDGNSSNLDILVNGTTDVLTIEEQFAATYTGPFGTQWLNRIEEVFFDNGFSYRWYEIMEKMVADAKTGGNDTIYGFSYEDTLDGGAGDDFLSGGNESDIYIFGLGYGQDVIHDQMTNPLGGDQDQVIFQDGLTAADLTFSRSGNNLIIEVTATGERLTIQSQFGANNLGSRFDEIESLVFGDGAVWGRSEIQQHLLQSTDGDDTLTGFFSDDVLDGGLGNDLLLGQDGADTYVFGLGYGVDVIHDQTLSIFAKGPDKLQLGEGITTADVSLSRGGSSLNDLVVTLDATGEQVTILGQFGTNNLGSRLDEVEEIHFADGTIWTRGDIQAQLLNDGATAGDDTLIGFFGTDIMDGGAGNDYMEGGNGGDIYVFGTGSGVDVIYDNASSIFADEGDQVVFTDDIAPEDVVLSRDGSSLIVNLTGSDDQLTIQGQFGWNNLGSRLQEIESFAFADGTVWNAWDIQLILLQGTAGDDNLLGFYSSDTLDGGAGNDTLAGGDGSDTYVFDVGYGHDQISESRVSIFAGEDDRVVFGPGITPADLALSREGNDLIMTVTSTGDSLRIVNEFWGSDTRVESFFFDDGTVWSYADVTEMMTVGTTGDDVIPGFDVGNHIDGLAGNDTLHGGSGNDTVIGGLGDDSLVGGFHNDTYIYTRGDGDDVIVEEEARWHTHPGGTADKLLLHGIDPAAVSLVRAGNDVTLVIAESAPGAGDGGSILLKNNLDEWYSRGVDEIIFDDGTVWTRGELRLTVLDQALSPADDVVNGFNTSDSIDAGAGNDTVFAGSGHDTIIGGAGDDSLVGGFHNDTYIYTRGDGNDVIVEEEARWHTHPGGTADTLILQGIDPAEISFVRNGNHITLVIAESAPGAGDAGSIELRNNLNEWYNRGIDQITFDDGTVWTRADLRALWLEQAPTEGNDLIQAFTSSDSIAAGGGDDTVFADSGNDTVDAGDGNDTVNGGSGNDSIIGGGGDDYLTGSHDQDTVYGGAGDDALFGGNGDDQLFGGDGNDTLRGDNGVDTFDGGAGIDTIDYSTSSSGLVIDLTTGDVSGLESFVNIENVIAGSGNDTVFGDAGANHLAGGGGDDSLVGGAGNDTFSGGGGVDSFVGGAGVDTADYNESTSDFVADLDSDTLTTSVGTVELLVEIENVLGSTGENALYGDAAGNLLDGYLGDDTLIGRGGDDTLLGGGGSDDFIYDIGDGNDLITEVAGESVGDRLVFGAGVAQGDVSYAFGVDQSELLVSLAGGGTIILQQQFAGDQTGVDSIQFADGTSISTLDIYDELTNVAPLVDQGIADVAIDEDAPLNLAIAADAFSDANLRNTLTYTAQLASGMALPAWLLFDGTAFAGTPLNADVGSLDIEVTATDDFGQSATTQFTLTVANTNDAPTVGDSLSTVEIEVGGSLAAAIPDAAFTDVDVGDQLTVTATLADGSPLPAWLQFDGATFTGMPGDSDVGFVALTIQATDLAGESVSQNMQINVLPSGGFALVLGTPGDDDLSGTVADELIVGGLGDDTLSGGEGNDVYLYKTGEGTDLLQNAQGRGIYDLDVLRFGEGIAVADVSLAQSGDDLLLSLAGGGQVLVEDYYHRGQLSGIEWFDGTTLSYTDVLAQTLGGTAGDDSLVGDSSNEVMAGGVGNDTIKSSTGADVLIGGAGNDYMEGWWHADIYVYNLGDGDDTIYEYSSSTQYSRHLGDKLVLGPGIAVGDIIVTRDAADWEDVTISFQGAAGSILLNEQFGDNRFGVEEIVFADGTIWNQSQLAHLGYAQAMTAGDDYIFGIHENDTINGGEGNDSLYGWLGADSLTGGAGNDYLEGSWHADTYIYNLGDGDDTIYEYSSSTQYSRHLGDKLVLGPGIAVGDIIVTRDAADWEDVTISFQGAAGSILLNEQFGDNRFGVEEIVFADGTIWNQSQLAHIGYAQAMTAGDDYIFGIQQNDTINGGEGNDSLYGWLGADSLTGGAGNDYLEGSWHADIYVYNLGDGDDTIYEYSSSTQYSRHLGDKLVLGPGIAVGDIIVTRDDADWEDVTISFQGAAGSILLNEQFGDNRFGVEEIVFADGAIWDQSQLAHVGYAQAMTAGDDYIFGIQQNDTINGGEGNDSLYGWLGADSLIGGAGNDYLEGSWHADTYVYNLGDGDDTIYEYSSSTQYSRHLGDKLILGSDFAPRDAMFAKGEVDALDVTITFGDSPGSILLDNQLGDSRYGLETIELNDGTIWTKAQIAGMVSSSGDDTVTGTVGENYLNGQAGRDLIIGNEGDDILLGGLGDDTLIGGLGSDTLEGGDGADTFVYQDLLDAGDVIDGFDATGPDLIDIDALLDSLGVADAERSARLDIQQAGSDQDAVISLDSDGDLVFETVLATVTNVTGSLDNGDVDLGTLV